MKQNKFIFWLAAMFIGLTLAACQATTVQTPPTGVPIPPTEISNAPASPTQTVTAPTVSVTDVPAATNAPTRSIDPASIVPITLNGDSITANNAGVQVNGTRATITAAGSYELRGALNDGQIIVNTTDEKPVQLILNGVHLANSTSAPLYIAKANETILYLADNSENFISDASAYVFENADEDEPNAALFSKNNLTIIGNGALTAQGNFNDGIASKAGLTIAGGKISVTAADDGMRGKDFIVVQNGMLVVNAQGDGLKADNDKDANKGYITVEGGKLNITSGGDALTAESVVSIANGEFNLTTGGGSNAKLDEDVSAKGIKAGAHLEIDGGVFNINAADDALHSKGTLKINDGEFTLATGDDAINTETTLEINAGKINITQSNEGIEGMVITLNGGDIRVVSSDDAINAKDPDTSGDGGGMGRPSRLPDFSAYTGRVFLYIHGGNIAIDATGDGLDANGAIQMTGGTVVINGPTVRMNGAVDYDAAFSISGGTLIAAGSSGMAQTSGDATSSQNSLLIHFGKTLPGGTLIHIQNSAGKNILTFAPTKEFQSLAFSSSQLTMGETYSVFLGGSATGVAANGLYLDGAYTPGEEFTTFTLTQSVTVIGKGGMR